MFRPLKLSKEEVPYSITVKAGEVVSSPNVVLVAVGNINGVSVRGEDVEITDLACL